MRHEKRLNRANEKRSVGYSINYMTEERYFCYYEQNKICEHFDEKQTQMKYGFDEK